MSVTYTDVQTTLGRTLTAAEQAQATLWIGDHRMLVGARLGDVAELDQDHLDYVVRESVAERLRNPAQGADRVTIAVDDASVTKSYRMTNAAAYILDEWWTLLSPATDSGVGFSTRPTFEADTPEADSWA